MPPRDPPSRPDTLTIPVYLAKANAQADPGLEQWKREHPDWFVAGHWTPGRNGNGRGKRGGGTDEGGSEPG